MANSKANKKIVFAVEVDDSDAQGVLSDLRNKIKEVGEQEKTLQSFVKRTKKDINKNPYRTKFDNSIKEMQEDIVKELVKQDKLLTKINSKSTSEDDRRDLEKELRHSKGVVTNLKSKIRLRKEWNKLSKEEQNKYSEQYAQDVRDLYTAKEMLKQHRMKASLLEKAAKNTQKAAEAAAAETKEVEKQEQVVEKQEQVVEKQAKATKEAAKQEPSKPMTMSDYIQRIDNIEKAQKFASYLDKTPNLSAKKENFEFAARGMLDRTDLANDVRREIVNFFNEQAKQVGKIIGVEAKIAEEGAEKTKDLSVEQLQEEIKKSLLFVRRLNGTVNETSDALSKEIKRIENTAELTSRDKKLITEPLRAKQQDLLGAAAAKKKGEAAQQWKDFKGANLTYRSDERFKALGEENIPDLEKIVDEIIRAEQHADKFERALASVKKRIDDINAGAAKRRKGDIDVFDPLMEKERLESYIERIKRDSDFSAEQKKQLIDPLAERKSTLMREIWGDISNESDYFSENVEKASKVRMDNITATKEDIEEEDALLRDILKLRERDASGKAVSLKEVIDLSQRMSAITAKAKQYGLGSEDTARIKDKFKDAYATLIDISHRAKEVGEEADKASGKISRLAERWNKLNRSSKKSNLEVSMKNVNRSLKKGALFLVRYIIGFRSMFYLVREIKNVAAQGLKEFAKFDELTNRTMTNLTNKFNQMKADMVSMASPLMQYLEPVLIRIMQTISNLLDKIGMLFAALNGQTNYKKAIAAQSNYADALKETAEEAKEAKTYLSGLDEIRTYDTGSDKSGSKSKTNGNDDTMIVGVQSLQIPDNILKTADKLQTVFGKIGELLRKLKTWLSEASAWTKTKLSEIGKWFQEKFAVIKEHWGWIGDFIMTVWNSVLKPVGVAVWEFLKTWWEWLKTAYGWVYEHIIQKQLAFFGLLFNTLGDLLGKLWYWYKDTVTNIIDHLKNAWNIIKLIVNNFPEFMAGVWQSIKEAAVAFWNWVVKKIKDWWNDLTQSCKDLWSSIKTVAKLIWQEVVRLWKENVAPWFTAEKWRNLGQKVIDGIKNAFSNLTIFDPIKDWWNEHVAPWFTWEKWQQIGRDAIEAVKSGLTSIQLPSFHLSWEPADTTSINLLGKTITIPGIKFYARGGIVNGATLFGNSVVGEDGREAIIPLERHTEWIRKVAEEIADILTDRLGNMLRSYPMPAVASGSLIPPRIQVDIEGLDGIASKMDRMLEKMDNQRGGSYAFTAQVNRKTLFQEVINEAKIQQASNGRNPFELR